MQSGRHEILVGNQRFPDTPAGRAAADAYRKKTGMKPTPIRKPLPGETPAQRRMEVQRLQQQRAAQAARRPPA